MKKIISLFVAAVLCLSFSGCCLKHEWEDATCTQPKTCAKCGKTEGDVLPHTPGDWSVVYNSFTTAEQTSALTCKDCGAELEMKTTPISTFVEGDHFLFSAQEYIDRLQAAYDALHGDDVQINFTYRIDSDGDMTFNIVNQNDSQLGVGYFMDENEDYIPADKADVTNIANIYIVTRYDTEVELDQESVFYLLTELLLTPAAQAADPAIVDESYNDALASDVYEYHTNKPLHDVYYSIGLDTDASYFILWISVGD